MKKFYLTSTIEVECESREELDKILFRGNDYMENARDGFMVDLFSNVQVDEVEYENAKSGVPSCKKCGNPEKMYWCDNCESSQEESGECNICGQANGVKYVVVLDEDYHMYCN